MRSLFIAAIVGIALLVSLGVYSCQSNKIEANNIQKQISAITQDVNKLPKGTKIKITTEEIKTAPQSTGGYHQESGCQVSAKDDTIATRGLSWWGLGGGEVIAKRQAPTVDEEGNYTGGYSKGYGVLESFWKWLKATFWLFAFAGIALLGLSFVPGTIGTIAGGILRTIAGIIPAIGAIAENIIGKKKVQTEVKTEKQLVKGNEEFKNAVALDKTDYQNFSNEAIKEHFINLWKNSQNKAQDESTQNKVDELKK